VISAWLSRRQARFARLPPLALISRFLERATFVGSDDPNDRVAEVAARAAISDARDKHERYIERLAVLTSIIGALAIAWRAISMGDLIGVPNLVITVAIGAYYGFSLLRPQTRSTRMKRWTRVTIEVSSATMVTVVNAMYSAEFGVTSSAHYTYFLAIAISSLRLDPLISLYAGALAITSHLTMYLYLRYGIGLPDTLPFHPALFSFRLSVMGLSALVGALLARTLREKTMKVATQTLEGERVRAAFGSYVDERVVQRVLSGSLSTGPERRSITVVFVDIRSFTSFSESRDPVEVFGSLHIALDAFSIEIQKQGGIVNKFLGDGLLALFGAPEPQADHQRRAVRAAIDIAAEAKRLSERGDFPGLNIGIGIHSGEAMVGNLGGARREYTAIGDVVNVASRVEAMNKELGTSILITKPVLDALGPDAEVRTFPSVTVRGRKEPLTLYELQRIPATREQPVPPEAPVGRIRVV